MSSKLFEIYNFTKRMEVISWMTQQKLLSDKWSYFGTIRKPHPQRDMKIEKRNSSIDGYNWRCDRCGNHKYLRIDSYFEKNKFIALIFLI